MYIYKCRDSYIATVRQSALVVISVFASTSFVGSRQWLKEKMTTDGYVG